VFDLPEAKSSLRFFIVRRNGAVAGMAPKAVGESSAVILLRN